MKRVLLLCFLVAMGSTSKALAADALLRLGDFSDSADLERWRGGDSGTVEMSLAPRSVTDSNVMLKVVFKSGTYPGISLRDTPRDWSRYETMRFVVWSDSPFKLYVRIDDAKSTDYKSRFNKVLALARGRNLCQITTREVARALNVKDVKAFILFGVRPPSGLVLWFDDFALGPRLAERVPFIPYEKRKDLQPTLKVITPHLPFGRNLAGGPVKAFVISGIRCGREVPELMQRLDLKLSLQTWDAAWDQNTWGMGDFYGQRGHRFDRVLMQRYLASSMQGPEKFDCLIMPTPVGWREFPPGARQALLKRVKEEGEGLVLIQPFPGESKWPSDLLELSALIHCESDYVDPASGYLRRPRSARVRGKAWKAVGRDSRRDQSRLETSEHPITRGVPLEALPFEVMTYVRYELAPGARAVVVSENGDPIVAIKQCGKGRVVTCAWQGSMITPAVARPAGAPPNRPYRYWEVMYSLIARCGLWAARREMTADGKPTPLAVTGENADGNLTAVQWRDKKGRVTDWALRFAPPGANGVARMKGSVPRDVPRGRPIPVAFYVPQELAGRQVTWTAVLGERAEGRWRTLTRRVDPGPSMSPFKPTRGQRTLDLPTDRVRQTLAIVRVEGKLDDKLVATFEGEVIVTPPGDPWDDYEVFMWPVDGLPFLRKSEDVLIRKSGATGVMETRWSNPGQLMRWCRAGLRVLPHNVDVRPLHIRPYNFAQIAKKWNETKDKKFLIRPHSYADALFLEATRKKMHKAAELLKPLLVPAYVLCDEPSLASYREEFDFDFHPANIELFREALKEKFGTAKAMNAALGTEFADFGDVVPPTSHEARAAQNWGLWNEWRAHNDTVMARGYMMYRNALRQVDERALISVSGTQIANPFDGFDWYKLSPWFDAMNGYGYGEQERKRMSFHSACTPAGQGGSPHYLSTCEETGRRSVMKNAKPAGYGNKGKGVSYQLWSALTEHGCGHVLFWWVSFRNPDLSWCRSAEDYREGFLEMRAGIGRQYQLGRRHTSPVGIQYSMNSMRAAWTRGRFGDYQSAVSTVTASLVGGGFDPVFVSDEQIAAGELETRRFKAVFLPMPLSLGKGERTGGLDVDGALAKFVARGGLVVATDDPACDEFLQPARPDAALVKKVRTFDAVKGKLSDVLARAGARPWVPVRRPDGAPVPGLSVTVHRLNGETPAYIVTLLRQPIGKKEVVGADGVLTYRDDPTGGRELEPCVVDVSALGLGHCTAIRTGRKMPVKDGRVELQMPSGDGLPLAVLPYAVGGIRLEAELKDRDLHVSWQLLRSAPAAGGFAPHAVRVEVGDAGRAAHQGGGSRPEPRPAPALSRNATCDANGAGALVIPLALEDAGRALKVSLKDILTGTQAGTTVKVPKEM